MGGSHVGEIFFDDGEGGPPPPQTQGLAEGVGVAKNAALPDL